MTFDVDVLKNIQMKYHFVQNTFNCIQCNHYKSTIWYEISVTLYKTGYLAKVIQVSDYVSLGRCMSHHCFYVLIPRIAVYFTFCFSKLELPKTYAILAYLEYTTSKTNFVHRFPRCSKRCMKTRNLVVVYYLVMVVED